MKAKGFGIQLETLHHAQREGLSIGEVEVPRHHRDTGKSKLGLRQIIGWLLTIGRLKRKKTVFITFVSIFSFLIFLGVLGS